MYDQSPVKSDNTRVFRLPDNDRIWFGIGANYIINDMFNVDFGYAHIYVKDTSLTQRQLSSSGVSISSADVDGSVNVFGLQLNINIC